MLLASSGFITICPKKEVELGADRHLHRADHAEELKKEIEFDCPKATGNQYAYLAGGGVRAINPNSSMTLAETDNLIAVFKGNLFNKAELAINVLGVHTPLGEAQLLLQLYAAKGLDVLGMLKGQFAFCLYDSKQARVLAARDHSGAVPLMEGRTAAGSLIIACGTFLPEGVTCMSDIKPGEYKYGWHALPRAFALGETRIVSGRASCDYGIRRRSIDAYNAPQRRSVDLQRHSSLDIARQHSGSHLPSPTSHSYSHTPGRYMPPHLAAAAAAGGSFSRQRATSFDGHNLQGGSSSSSHYHHGTPPASGGRRRSDTNTHGSRLQPHPSPATQHWAPKSPLAVAAGSPAAAAATPAVATPSKPAGVPPPIQTTPAAGLHADEVATPGSIASSTPSAASGSVDTPHRRKRRHHRRGRTSPSPNAASTAAAAAAAAAGDETNDGQASEADSQVSSSTHDSANSGPAAAAGTAGTAGTAAAAKQQGNGRRGGNKGAAAKSAGKAAAQQKTKEPKQQQQQQEQRQQQRRSSSSSSGGGSSGGFKRNGSCGELAVLGSSPTAHARSVLMAAPQGLAC